MAEEEEKVEEKAAEPEEKKGKPRFSLFRVLGVIVLAIIFVLSALAVSHYTKLVSDLDDIIRTNKAIQQNAQRQASEEIAAGLEEDEEALIMAAVLEVVGLEEDEADFAITTNTGTHAKGNINEAEAEVSGGYWLAAKTEYGWTHVYDGQAHPTCEQIEPYDFPLDLVEDCLDEEGEVVTRE